MTHPIECVVCGARFTPNLIALNGFIVCSPCVAWESKHPFVRELMHWRWPHVLRSDAAAMYVRTMVFKPRLLPAAISPDRVSECLCRLTSHEAYHFGYRKAETYASWASKLLSRSFSEQ